MTPQAELDAALRAGGIACREERADDRAFLADLFVACSPLAAMLPDAMVRGQAALQYAAYAGAWPDAMRRIVTVAGGAVGRIVIGWSGGGTHCVDVALLPAQQGQGTGTRLLAAWLAVADARGLAARLEVRAGNPAARLYARLGFVPDPATAGEPFVTMTREAVHPAAQRAG